MGTTMFVCAAAQRVLLVWFSTEIHVSKWPVNWVKNRVNFIVTYTMCIWLTTTPWEADRWRSTIWLLGSSEAPGGWTLRGHVSFHLGISLWSCRPYREIHLSPFSQLSSVPSLWRRPSWLRWATPNTFARFYNLRMEPVSSRVLIQETGRV